MTHIFRVPRMVRSAERPGRRPPGHTIRRAVLGALLAMLVLLGGSVPTMASGPSQADRVVRAVSSHIGARYVWGSTGPRGFDCSGLVYRAFREAHVAKSIGGFNTAHGYYARFRQMGRATRSAPRVGDIVVYNNGGHVGIYVGHGMVVSALLRGVVRHPIRGLNIPFTAILRVDLGRHTSGRGHLVPAAPVWPCEADASPHADAPQGRAHGDAAAAAPRRPESRIARRTKPQARHAHGGHRHPRQAARTELDQGPPGQRGQGLGQQVTHQEGLTVGRAGPPRVAAFTGRPL